MKKYKIWQSISTKLLLAIAISYGVTLVFAILISNVFITPYLYKHQQNIIPLKYNLIIIPTFMLIFIISFLFLIKNKIIYLNQISKTVETISQGNLGITIELQGKDELTQLSKNINTMSKELENKFNYERQLENVKNELITSVSHDLRTPLTSIIGYTNLLRNNDYNSKEELDEYLNTIYSKSIDLKNLINELFEFTKVSSPDITLNTSPIDLSQLLQQIIGENIPMFQKEQLSIHMERFDDDIYTNLDVEKMVRVFDNLFSNALKYSLKPSTIKIHLLKETNYVLFSISNKVEHVDSIQINRLFDRFYRQDKTRKSEGSAGLGLAISKRIIELHNGSIWAELNNDGITFFIKLDLTLL